MANTFNWQNGNLVSKAKVQINGQIYEVEPEEYSGNTALSAENLNSMQTILLSNIVNSLDSDDTDKAPSIKVVKDNLTNLKTYSSDEINTGMVWFNGKPIYRKVFSGTKSGALQFNISDLNIDEVTNAYGNLHVQEGSDNQYRHIPSYGSSSNYVSYEVSLNTNTLNIVGATAPYSQGEVTFVLEYTKTTD